MLKLSFKSHFTCNLKSQIKEVPREEEESRDERDKDGNGIK